MGFQRWKRQIPTDISWQRRLPTLFHVGGVCEIEFIDGDISLRPDMTKTFTFRYRYNRDDTLPAAADTVFGMFFYATPPEKGQDSPNRLYNDTPTVVFRPERPQPTREWQTSELDITTSATRYEQMHGLLFIDHA